MVDALYFLLPGIIALGIITSYEDIKEGKIRNKYIVGAIIYSILALLAFYLVSFYQGELISNKFIIETAVNIIIALLVGFFMWYLGIWTAGDGKLFFAYSALLPITAYKFGYLPYFPSMIILINTFVPIFIFLLINLLIKSSTTQKKNSLKSMLRPQNILGLILFIYGFGGIITWLFSALYIPPNYFLTIIILFIIYTGVEKLFRIKYVYIVAALSIIRILFDPGAFSSNVLIELITFTLLFMFFRYFVLDIGFYSFTTSVQIKDLKQGMVPAEMVYKQKHGYEKKKLLFFSFFGYLSDTTSTRIFDPKSEGLSKKDIQKLKQLHKKHPQMKDFRIQETLPFAPFMLLGVILTLVFQGNLFLALAVILSNLF